MFDYHHKKYVIRQFLRLVFLIEVKNRIIGVYTSNYNNIVIAETKKNKK